MNRLNFPFFKLPIKNNENKKFIFDFIRKKWVALTPEEWVRQNTISYLREKFTDLPLQFVNFRE